MNLLPSICKHKYGGLWGGEDVFAAIIGSRTRAVGLRLARYGWIPGRYEYGIRLVLWRWHLVWIVPAKKGGAR